MNILYVDEDHVDLYIPRIATFLGWSATECSEQKAAGLFRENDLAGLDALFIRPSNRLNPFPVWYFKFEDFVSPVPIPIFSHTQCVGPYYAKQCAHLRKQGVLTFDVFPLIPLLAYQHAAVAVEGRTVPDIIEDLHQWLIANPETTQFDAILEDALTAWRRHKASLAAS